MSALEFLIDEAARHGIPKDSIKEAREELELLREAAFLGIEHGTKLSGQLGLTHVQILWAHPNWQRILRTDPERAKKMGLGWAL